MANKVEPPASSPTQLSTTKDASSLEKGGSDDIFVTDAPANESERVLEQSHGRILRWLYTLGVEARGVERVPETERSAKHAITIWVRRMGE